MNMSACTILNEQDNGSNVTSHDLCLENKMYKRKRSIASDPLSQIYEMNASINDTLNTGMINGKAGKGEVCKRAKQPTRPRLVSSFCNMKRLVGTSTKVLLR